MNLQRLTSKVHWLLLAIIALAASLRLFGLDMESFWGDEVFSVVWADADPITIIKSTAITEPHPPLYYLLLHYWMTVFGDSEAVVRSLSALFGVISVLLIYRVGSVLYDRKVGLIAGFLLAVSAFAIQYSQEARAYSLFLLLTLASFLFFLLLLKTGKPRKTHFALYTIANVLLCYTHLFGILAVSSQILYFLLFRRRWAHLRVGFWAVQAITLVLFSPWIYALATYASQEALPGLDWIDEPSLRLVARTIAELSGAWHLWRPLGVVLVVAVLLLGTAGVLLVPKAAQRGDSSRSLGWRPPVGWARAMAEHSTALLLMWLLFPFVVTLVVSATLRPVFWDRYLIGIAPALVLLAASGIAKVSTFARSRVLRVNVLALLVASVGILSVLGVQGYFTHTLKPEWREVAALVEQEYRPGDAIVTSPKPANHPFYYYYLGEVEVSRETRDVVGIDESTEGKERVWLVFESWGIEEDAPVLDDIIADYGAESMILEQEFTGVTVFLFEL